MNDNSCRQAMPEISSLLNDFIILLAHDTKNFIHKKL